MTVFIYICIAIDALVIIAMILGFVWLLASSLRMTERRHVAGSDSPTRPVD